MRSREQQLVDICFQLVSVSHDKEHRSVFENMTREERMKWVAEQLRECGFSTQPCGASWGILE